MLHKDTTTPRLCLDCDADISNRGGKSVRCIPCAASYKRQCQQERERADATIKIANRPSRFCLDCDVDISTRHLNALRCEPCATERNQRNTDEQRAYDREYKAQLRSDPQTRTAMNAQYREWQRADYKRNPDKWLEKSYRRNNLKRGTGGEVTKTRYQLWKEQGGKCGYCQWYIPWGR